MAFKYSKKLDELEELAESKSEGRFSGFWAFILAILRSRYLFVSVCFYLALLMILGGVVVSHYVINKTTFEPQEGIFLRPGSPHEPKPASGQRSKPSTIKETGKTGQASPSDQSIKDTTIKNAANRIAILTPPSSPRPGNQFAPPPVELPGVKPATPMADTIDIARIDRWRRVSEYRRDWVKESGDRSDRGNKRGIDGTGYGDANVGSAGEHHGIHAEFVIFQAKYQDGDWDCNGPYSSGTNTWDLSALKNFMFQVRQWSRDRIKASVVPKVLDIGMDEIFAIKPPFIYLTGHKDFHFLDREIKNLRDYLTLGGCVWADSALAGRRSRFDIAFRREIKLVLPDREFEIVKPDHEMFNTYFKDINLPVGMNFYHEPAEIINIDDEMVVLYTLNGYGHFWESRLNRDGKIDWNRINFGAPGMPHWTYDYGPHLGSPRAETSVLYRNLNDESVRDVYKFGVNVLVCLLTQYDDKIKFLPKNLPAIEPQPKPGKK